MKQVLYTISIVGLLIVTYFNMRKKVNVQENSRIIVSIAHEALKKFLQKPSGTITCNLLTGGIGEDAVVKCSHGDTNYIVKLFQDTAIGKNEALWTEFASHLGIGPSMYYADPAGTYFIIKCVTGTSLTSKKIANPLILQNIAKAVALLHRSNTLFAHKADIFTRIKSKYESLQTSGALQSLLVSLWRHLEILKASILSVNVVLVPCHNDLNPRNIFVDGNHATLIDWGDASMDNPFYDIAAFFILNSLTQEQEELFLTEYDVALLEKHWQSYLSMLKQFVRFEFALNVLHGVQEYKKDLLAAIKLPQTKSLQHYLALFAEQQVSTDAPFKYSMALASLNEMRNIEQLS